MTPDERWLAFPGKVDETLKSQFLKVFQEEYQRDMRELCDMWAARAMNRAGIRALEEVGLIEPDPENEE